MKRFPNIVVVNKRIVFIEKEFCRMIPVFISRPNPFTFEQAYFLDQIINVLNTSDFQNITLEAADYNPYESLTCMNELIKRCYGMLIIAFGQYYIASGTSKKGAIHNPSFFDSQELDLASAWITSPFCHIEGALGFNNQIPILIIEQRGIKIEGILKQGTHALIGPQFNLDSDIIIDNYINSHDFNISFFSWKKQVIQKFNFVNNIIY